MASGIVSEKSDFRREAIAAAESASSHTGVSAAAAEPVSIATADNVMAVFSSFMVYLRIMSPKNSGR